jgi:Fe(II)/alpha-ketoglutarate-dependent arginine beta-hydroxylase
MAAEEVVVVDPSELLALAALSKDASLRYASSEDPELLADLILLGHEVPRRLRKAVNDFRLSEGSGYLLIKGYQVDDQRVGPTPTDWRLKTLPGPAFQEELLLLLFATLLGEPFGWKTQQNGRLIHEVFPIKADESAQLGTSSNVVLTWHTEDAFHSFRPDYVLLFGIRNEGRVPTSVGCLDVSTLGAELLDLLFSERFIIKPDNSHLPKYNTIQSPEAKAAHEGIIKMNEMAPPIAVLFGDRKAPYLRLDPFFMETGAEDSIARRALDAIVASIDASMQEVVLEAGDILVIDNYKVVHGRQPFKANYDGRDRWLKRINVTRDLRKSRAYRSSATGRLIG